MRQSIWGDFDSYENVDLSIEPDLQGWREGHPLLTSAAKNALTMAEIGVWKGAGCAQMAEAQPNAQILAVDTWRGSAEHWLRERWKPDVAGDLYTQFRRNMIDRGIEDRVTPLPLDSVNAAIVCNEKGLRFDLIHVDAAHDYSSVYCDLVMWGGLVNETGVIVADDYAPEWPEVVKAVRTFAHSNGWRIVDAYDGKALLKRGAQ